MKALIINQLNSRPVFTDLPPTLPGETEVQVNLKASALNHRDLFITQGLYAGIKIPCVLGSDGAGECDGQRVLIYPALEWGDSPDHQSKQFRVLGMPEHGTFAEQITIPKDSIYAMPEHLSWEEGAALPLAGLTAWRTLMSRCQLRAGERVLITGIGGGVALMALQFALASGAEVWVNSGASQKIEQAKAIGASGGVNYKESDWDKQLKQQAGGGFDVIIDSAGGDGFALFPGLCNPGARIGFYGGTLGKVNGLSLQPIFWKQISLLGSTMGSPGEFADMLAFVQKHHLRPVIDSIYPLSQGNTAFDRMENGGQFGKIVMQNTL
ncbi:MAG TPA: zinc-binding dehydrogenase [Saprospiraceae bacterium]|nr:zinc-binding dehydrogenase [Saprospiraceae bacterium]